MLTKGDNTIGKSGNKKWIKQLQAADEKGQGL
jgi:hypothetical protein